MNLEHFKLICSTWVKCDHAKIMCKKLSCQKITETIFGNWNFRYDFVISSIHQSFTNQSQLVSNCFTWHKGIKLCIWLYCSLIGLSNKTLYWECFYIKMLDQNGKFQCQTFYFGSFSLHLSFYINSKFSEIIDIWVKTLILSFGLNLFSGGWVMSPKVRNIYFSHNCG